MLSSCFVRVPVGLIILAVVLPGVAAVAPRVAAQDATGDLLWVRQFGSPVDDWAEAVAADASGAYVAGLTRASLPGQTSSGAADAYLRSYDVNGTERWTRQFGTPAHDTATAVAVQSSGVYVAGDAGPLGAAAGAESGGSFLRKYDVDGNVLWTRLIGTAFVEEVAVHASGVYIAGSTSGTFEGETSAGSNDAFLRKYDVNGNVLWTRQIGTAGPDHAAGIAFGASGVYITGSTGYYGCDASGAFEGQTAHGCIDAFLASFLSSFEYGPDTPANLEGRIRDLEQANARLSALGQQLLLGLIGVFVANVLLFAIPRLRPRSGGKLGLEDINSSGPAKIAFSVDLPRPPPPSDSLASRPARKMPVSSPSDRALRLTTKERVLLHLAGYAPHEDAQEVPPAMTQEGIAAAAWVDQRHFSQYVNPLVRDGLVRVRTAHVRNGHQRRRIYELSDAGRRIAVSLAARAKSEVVQVWDGEHVWEVRVGEILTKLSHKVTILDVARQLAQAGVVDFADLGADREEPSVDTGMRRVNGTR